MDALLTTWTVTPTTWSVTPTTWTIDESKRSKMVFTVTCSEDISDGIGTDFSNHFDGDQSIRHIKAGSSEKYVVEYLPNKGDPLEEMYLIFSTDPFGIFESVKIEIKKTDANSAPTQHQEKNSNFLECKICFLKYDEEERTPRLLTCGHTLCAKCAESLWKDQNQQKIDCPFDRTVTTLPNSEHGINNLPKNFSLLEMIESEKKKTVEEALINKEPSDTPCAENPHHEATVFCVSCEMDLCEECCAKVHLPRIFQSHKKLPLSEKLMQFPKCPIHPYTTAKFNCLSSSCSQPSKLFCHNCLIQEHRAHSYEHLMDTVSRNQQELLNSIPDICEKIGELKSFVHWQGKYTASYQPNSPMLLERRNNLIEQFELKKQKALSDFDAGVDIRKKECQIMEKKLESQSKNVSEIKKEVEKILKLTMDFFRIEDLTKRTKEILDEEVDCVDALDHWDTCLNEKMELTWELKEEPDE